MNPRSLFVLGAVSVLFGCGSSEEPYKATPAWSGRKANLPAPPSLPSQPIKAGDAYTVYGTVHHMRSRIHGAEVTGKEIAIVGYIIESNISTAPPCAVHKTGKKDPEDCLNIPIPSFTIADTKDAKPTDAKTPRIRVMGWAANFANVFEAMEKYKNLKEAPKELYKDELWAVDVPYPLPAVGAKVKVTARTSFGRARPRASRCAIRAVSARVLPVPAPASISTGPSSVSTASRCAGFSPCR